MASPAPRHLPNRAPGHNPSGSSERMRQGGGAASLEPVGSSGWLLLTAFAYLLFVIYGSLVPLHFRGVPWEVAVERFRHMPYLALGVGSRADWVANILLFIPLSFLWAGVFWPRRAWARLPVAALLLALATALSVAIEFVQIYFPPRTVSLNDIVAETTGAAIGIGLWWSFGGALSRWLQSLPLASGTVNVAQRLLLVYLAALFGYNLLPLDLTISPVEIYHKWSEGKVIWVPFTTAYDDMAQRLYDLITDVAIWVPAAALWVLAGRKTRMQAWTAAVVAATGLELMQLFVYSRVSDSTDIFTAAVGAAIGVGLVRPRAAPAAPGPASAARPLLWLLAAAVWLVLLMAVFWYPFDFQVDRAFLRDRLASLDRVPFESYYYGTEYRAATEVLRKSLFFAPLGFTLYKLAAALPSGVPRGLVHGAALIVLGMAAGAIEAGQLLLPGKIADFTDAALQFLGGAAGYFGSLFVARRLKAGGASSSRQAPGRRRRRA